MEVIMEQKIKDLILNPIKQAGYILDSVEYVKENGTYFLRIIIDKKDEYITVNDCVVVNDLIDPILDKVDFIDDSYIVDICSKEKGCE
jgi:ribosome maturation factor RimP